MKCSRTGCATTNCDPDELVDRARALVAGDAIHPMLRALWQPRLIEAIQWIAEQERANRADGRAPIVAEAKGETVLGGVTLHGRADRIDRLCRQSLGDHRLQDRPAARSPRRSRPASRCSLACSG